MLGPRKASDSIRTRLIVGWLLWCNLLYSTRLPRILYLQAWLLYLCVIGGILGLTFLRTGGCLCTFLPAGYQVVVPRPTWSFLYVSRALNLQLTIKFTASWSEEEVTFLDTRVYLEDGQIGTALHVKLTDTYQYLRMDSCHTHLCKISIPYSQALRLRRICSEDQHLQKWTRELKRHLIKRGYREQQLDNEIHRALAISRENCLQSRPNQDRSARIPLVVTYHPILPNLQSITRRHLSTLHTSELLREAFSLPPLIAFRRPKNLRDFLVRATLTTNNQEPPGNRPCGATGCTCKTCPIQGRIQDSGKGGGHSPRQRRKCES